MKSILNLFRAALSKLTKLFAHRSPDVRGSDPLAAPAAGATGSERKFRKTILPGESSHLGFGTQAGETKTIIVNWVKFTFCWCPPGEFMMGTPEEQFHYNGETLHPVRLTKGFWLLESAVTQEQWQEVMGHDKDRYLNKHCRGDSYPMDSVSWEESAEFCRKLSERTGENVQLPTEAQWEYACRAGTTGPYAGTGNLDEMGWYDKRETIYEEDGWVDMGSIFEAKPQSVKRKEPNAWGLYDMHGNVWEWCSDWYGENYYAESPSTDPTGPASGSCRVCRGGNSFHQAVFCRSAYRGREEPSSWKFGWGFRPAVVPSD